VLLGWWRDIGRLKSISPQFVDMKANTALAFVLAGAALWMVQPEHPNRRRRLVAQGCAAAVALLGLLTLTEDVLHRDLVDQLLFLEPVAADAGHPGRMAHPTAAGFLALGIALLAVSVNRAYWMVQSVTLGTAVVFLVAVIGYLYDVAALYAISPYSTVSVYTALGFTVLSAGVLCARPEHGLMGLVSSDTAGGMMVRRLLPVGIVAPVLMGWVRLEGQRAGLYGPELGASVDVVALITLFSVVVLWNGRSLYRTDRARQRAEEEIRRLNAVLEHRVGQRTAALTATNSKLEEEIAEREQAETALRNREEYFRSLIENGLDLIALLSDDGSVRYASPSHQRVLGYAPHDLIGKNAFAFVHPDDLTHLADTYRRLMERPDIAQSVEFRFRHADGSWRTLEARGSQLAPDSVVTGMVVNSRDVSERKRALEQAQQHQAELAHVLRVSTIGEMAAGLAHEISQPLSAIVSYAKGSARHMRAGTGQRGELLDTMEQIAAQAVRADQIVRRLREFVRKQEPRREQVNLNDLVRDVVGLIEADAREQGTRLWLMLPADLPPVQVDVIQIEQVILNLVRNGLEAMDGAGRMRGVLSIHTAMLAADAVEVTVSDTGEGLGTEIAEKVFEPFFTTKPHGLGMGLSISRSIVEAHGGRLWAMANAERGTTFHFTVPLEDGGPPHGT
jgi:two-component system, LuxR family, sensor kinase FixL